MYQRSVAAGRSFPYRADGPLRDGNV